MPDSLAIIDRVIKEHQRIRSHIKLVGESTNDMEAMFSLQQAYSGWTLGSMEVVSDKQTQLQQTVSFLDEGLNNHFAFEERFLPPLFGELLMQALLVEHKQIRQEIGEVKSLLAGGQLAGLEQEKLLSQKSRIQQMINALSRVLEDHASREETILNMMKRALEEKTPDKS